MDIRIYSYELKNSSSTSIDDLFIEHFGVKGMKWGIRKDRKKGGNGNRRRRNSKKATNKEEALKKRDLKYIYENKNQFSTKELNDLMNRIATEQRLSSMYKSSKSSNKIKRVLNSRAFKIALGVGITAVAVAGATFYRDMYKGYKRPDGTFVKMLPDKTKSAFKSFNDGLKNNIKEEGMERFSRMNGYVNVRKITDVLSDIVKK